MSRWEYRWVEWSGNCSFEEYQREVNELGADGWRVIRSTPGDVDSVLMEREMMRADDDVPVPVVADPAYRDTIG